MLPVQRLEMLIHNTMTIHSIYLTSGAAAAAISLLIGAAPVSGGALSNRFRQNCGGSSGL